ncbi:high frequency lysogenization protein HflD [Isoalcanivorax beigongshangi]|uniref:High frequency lysogenization protein HflD homolog n=1 Tax=Isoalcanivorax beigongshangi TaxID=3238810 RepID=A0ABV4AGF5_9GAMM
MNASHHQVLGLAAVMQAALLADDIASQGTLDAPASAALFEAALCLAPNSYEDVFPQPQQLDRGLRFLLATLQGGRHTDPARQRSLSYGLALLHLSDRLRRDRSLMQVLRERLESLDRQRAHFPDLSSAEFAHRLAGIYVDTLGTFRFRIKVRGEPTHLRNEILAARIRALFLSGVRAAFLWHQAGGRRRHWILSRRRLVKATKEIINSYS